MWYIKFKKRWKRILAASVLQFLLVLVNISVCILRYLEIDLPLRVPGTPGIQDSPSLRKRKHTELEDLELSKVGFYSYFVLLKITVFLKRNFQIVKSSELHLPNVQWSKENFAKWPSHSARLLNHSFLLKLEKCNLRWFVLEEIHIWELVTLAVAFGWK